MSGSAKKIRTVCPYCGVGCGLVLHVKAGRVSQVTGDKEHTANFGRLCTKGVTCAEPLTAPDRLAHAHIRAQRDGAFERVSLDVALSETAARFQKIIAEHGPDAVAVYVSGQLSTESQYLANKLFKGFLRTNNIDSNSRLCMASAASGYKLSLGADAPPGSYQDIDKLDCALVIGSNMAECHPILFLRLLDRKKDGAKLIVVDPRLTPTAEKADLYLPIKPGTDLALLNGLLYLLESAGHVDETFIAQHTDGWVELKLMLADYTPSRVAEITGLREEDIRTAARWIGESPELTTFWTMGLNQSTHGTWHTNAICNLHLATGKICRPGSGPFSLTGQPNAMGGREVGYLSHGLPGQRTVTNAKDRAAMEAIWSLPTGAIRAEPGLDAVALFKKMEAGEVKALWVIGTNPVASMPNRARVIAGLQRAELVVVQDAFHPTETSRYADILLPGALWAEAEGTMINSERNVTLMPQAVPPPGEAQPDWLIIARIAQLLGFEKDFNYPDAAAVFDEIRSTWNSRTGYDLRGMDYGKLSERPRQWPCPPGEDNGKSIRYVRMDHGKKSLHFATENGRGHFFARPYLPPAEMPDAGFPFALTNGRLAHQWHTLTKTGKVPTLNKLNPGAFVEVHPEDAARLQLEEGALLKVASRRGFAVYPARITTRVRPGDCFAPIHWNDQFGENLCVNAATNDACDAISLQPEFKFSAVSLAKVEADTNGDFTSEQKKFLRALVGEMLAQQQTNGHGSPVLPKSAPFSASQRRHLDELFAKTGMADSKIEKKP